MKSILTPPVAILLYTFLVFVLYLAGRLLAPKVKSTAAKSSIYTGGEIANTTKAAPGYRRFFVVALFFAVLHLGALVLATAGLAGYLSLTTEFTTAILIYLAGLALVLVILFLN